MAKVNRGKQFEEQIRKGFENAHISIDRIPDQTMGYAGANNICDFIVYKYPNIFYLECKCLYGNTLSINSNDPKRLYGDISNAQWNGLKEKTNYKGIIAGVVVWYIDHDMTVFIPIEDLWMHKEKGHKSVNIKDLENGEIFYTELVGNKRRVLFDYDMAEFVDGVLWDIRYGRVGRMLE